MRHYVLLVLILFYSAATSAAGFAYSVQIDAPNAIKDKLEKHLEVVKAEGDARTSAEYIDHLAVTTPDEVRKLLATEGYFSPEIGVDYQSETGRFHVQVTPGQPVRIKSWHLQMTGAIREDAAYLVEIEKQAQWIWPLPSGAVFTQADWEAGKKALHNLLTARRYPGAHLGKTEARVDPVAGIAELTVEIDSGPFYRYGPIQINGLSRYPEKLVRSQAQFKEGDEFQRSDLLDMQTRLQNLSHFGLALVEADLPEAPPYLAPIRIELKEVPRNKLTTSVGYTTNTGFTTGLEHVYFNFLGQGWLLDNKITLAQKSQEVESAVVLPRRNSAYTHRVYVNYARSRSDSLLTESWSEGLTRQIDDFNLSRTWNLEYQTERRYLADGTVERPETLALKFIWLRRDLDNVRDPHRGNLRQVEAGGAVQGVLSDETFFRLYGRTAQYWPVGARGVLIARIEAAQTFAKEEAEVPSAWLFRAGGAGSVRGYDYQSLGPTKSGSIVPGRVLLTSTLEYQHPIYRQWRAATFVDCGDAADRWSELRSMSGLGIGARWASPAGMFGADLARGLNDQQWRFQVAIGLVF